MRFVKELLEDLKCSLGLDFMQGGGRSSDINRRVAKIMGAKLVTETPAEEYARLAQRSRPLKKKKRKAVKRVSNLEEQSQYALPF